jgi:ATP-dependent helicase HepA
VIFVSDIELANIYTKELKDLTSENSAYNIAELVNLDKHILQFFEENKNARFLVCDKNAEEGLDLQFADAIIHLDLPLNPSRIEQRIGRLDRFGRKKSNKIQHLVIIPTDDISYPWSNWFELLIDGFGIFSEPISDVQLKLENITKLIHSNLLQYGSVALENYFNVDGEIESTQVEHIRNIIVQEREYLDEQYALNYLTLSESDSLSLRDEIEDGEYEEKEIENDINYWLFRILRFYNRYTNDKSFELQWSKKNYHSCTTVLDSV